MLPTATDSITKDWIGKRQKKYVSGKVVIWLAAEMITTTISWHSLLYNKDMVYQPTVSYRVWGSICSWLFYRLLALPDFVIYNTRGHMSPEHVIGVNNFKTHTYTPPHTQKGKKPSILPFLYLWKHEAPGGGRGTQLSFFGGCVPRGFQNVGSRERIFLKNGGLGNENLENLHWKY